MPKRYDMAALATSAPASPNLTSVSSGDAQALARITGALILVTSAGSIPAFFWSYAPALTDPSFILTQGFDHGTATGALLELLVVLAHAGTALTLYPLLMCRFPVTSPCIQSGAYANTYHWRSVRRKSPCARANPISSSSRKAVWRAIPQNRAKPHPITSATPAADEGSVVRPWRLRCCRLRVRGMS